mgnify:CR=1 FL=1
MNFYTLEGALTITPPQARSSVAARSPSLHEGVRPPLLRPWHERQTAVNDSEAPREQDRFCRDDGMALRIDLFRPQRSGAEESSRYDAGSSRTIPRQARDGGCHVMHSQ